MRACRLWIPLLVAALIMPALLLAQDYKTINKPGVMQANVSTDDEKGKPLKIKKGEKVTVIYNREDWMWVKTKGGRSGWVLKKEVKILDGKPDAVADAKDAKKEDKKTAKQAAAEEAKRKKEEEKAAKQAAAEEAKRKKEEEKAAKQAAAEEAKRKKEEEKAAKQQPEAKKVDAVAAAPAAAQPAPQPAEQPEPAPVAEPPPRKVARVEKPEPVAPAPNPGFITVFASEPGAVVLLDNQRVGEIPLKRFAVDGGRHQITVMKDDFQASTQEVEVNGNEVPVNLALVPNPAYRDSHKMAVWRNRGLGLAAMGAGGTVATAAALVGLVGALVWVAGNTYFINNPSKDMVMPAFAVALASAVVVICSPFMAFAAGAVGGAGGAVLMMFAGDPSRYAQYGE